jgi:hypothetical protein
MVSRTPNPITGCIIVLQIEHIGLEFNIKVVLFLFSLREGTTVAEGRRRRVYPYR